MWLDARRQSESDSQWVRPQQQPTSAPPSWLSQSRLRLSEHRMFLGVGDLVTSGCAVVGALWLWSVVAGDQLTPEYAVDRAGWLILVVPWLVLLQGASHPTVAFSIRSTAGVGLRAVAVIVGLYLAMYVFLPPDLLPRLVLLYFVGLAFGLTLAWRSLYIRVFTRDRHRYRIAILGTGPAARFIADAIAKMAPQTVVVAFVADRDLRSDEPLGLPEVSGARGLRGLLAEQHIAELVLAPTGEISPELLRAVVQAQEAGVEVVRLETVYEQLLRRIPINYLQPDWVLTSLVDAMRYQDASRVAKRMLDILGGCVGCVIFLCLLPFLGLAIWLDSGGPVLFRQERVGLGDRPFRLLKFRTMARDAEPDGPRWADDRDHRATRLGLILRRSRLDEVPQFVNVLLGEMSLVGPRPERPEFVEELEELIPFYRTRLLVRPGLTGWAQVNYRYGNSVADSATKLEYDLYYIKHRTLLFDLGIAMRTVKTVLMFAGR